VGNFIKFEENKNDLLGQLDAMRQKKKDEAFAKDHNAIVIFAANSPFIEGLINTLERKYLVKLFSDVNEACAFCIDHVSNRIIMDMDLPTDWKLSMDLFTTVKTVNPGARIIVCTKDPGTKEVRTLIAQKAEVLELPFSANVLFGKLDNPLKI
jgi:DNA-binding NtrC family response regulator